MISTPAFAQAQIAYRQERLGREFGRAARPARDRPAVPSARRLVRASRAA